jgi:PBSX family phage terminase large subunit
MTTAKRSKKKDPKNLTKDEAIEKLWRMGELTWKLNKVQKELKEIIDGDTTKTSVLVVSRRTGKSYLMLVLSLMQCLKNPNSVVKYVFPKAKDAKTNILPLMRMITEDCPRDLIPKFNTQDKIFYFKNGSQIQLAGSDNGNIESVRGGFAHLCIFDEVGFGDNVKYAVRSVLSPTIRTTDGKIILVSTPSLSPDHEFVTEFMLPYKAAGRLKIFTIYDNPNFTPEIVQEIINDYPLGVDDPDFKREYLCEVAIDEQTSICPEFHFRKNDAVITSYELPEYRDFYVGADIGYRDLTVILFGYYDFYEATLYVIDELVMNGPEMTTDELAKQIKLKENLRFSHSGTHYDPYRRVMDVDLKLINDLNRLHGMKFLATKKDNKEGAINEMRMWVSQGRIKIHERCTHLRYHLEYGQWNNTRTDFKRLADSPDKTIRGGHVDAIPALYYLIRNIQTSKNPFPFGYGRLITKDTFVSPKYQENEMSQATDFMRKILNISKK